MGFTPQQVERMSLWQFSAAIAGYAKAQGGEEKTEAPTDEEFMRWIEGEADGH